MCARPIYGWELAAAIGQATRGDWRPSAGAVYPVLRHLVEEGWALTTVRDGRKLYAITATGRSRLVAFEAQLGARARRFAHLRPLFLELLPPARRVDWSIGQLKATLDGFVATASEPSGIAGAARRRLAALGEEEMAKASRRLRALSGRLGSGRGR